MNGGSAREQLTALRDLLVNLVDAFELDDPERGLVGTVPVVGGTFLHPLTREPLERLKVYGAGADRIKIAEPKFLRSIPRMSVAELIHPSQLCAGIAKTLSEILGELGALRNQAKELGAVLDLEHDVLRLSGKAEVDGIHVEIVTRLPNRLVMTTVGEHVLSGSIPQEERTLILKDEAGANRESLAALVRSLDERVRRIALEHVARKLGFEEQPEPQEPPAPGASGVSGVSQPSSQFEGAEEQKEQEDLPTAPPLPQLAPPPSLDTQTFASVTSEVLELTETVETTGEVQAQPAVPQSGTPEESLGAVSIKDLYEKLGSDAEISSHGGKIRLVVPLKVVQGLYTFYLEQRGPTRFAGFLVSPQGTRHTVDFDLREVEDIKQIFDRVVLGRQDFV